MYSRIFVLESAVVLASFFFTVEFPSSLIRQNLLSVQAESEVRATGGDAASEDKDTPG